jgi:cyclohexanecarboxylate-CoA ligase
MAGYLYGISATVLLGATGVWLDVLERGDGGPARRGRARHLHDGREPFLQDMAYTPATDRHDARSLRLFICGGAAIPRKLVEDARPRLGCAISAGWGMSENGLVTCNGLDDPEEKVFGTDGRPLPGAKVTVVDADGHAAPAGVEGDLLVRAPSLFIGYFRRPEFTAESYTADGWFRTGDRGTLDREGYLSITGRSKDLIIRGGENLSAAEIENLLFPHPKVASVVIVGMPDPRLQERVCAFVIPKPGPPPTLAELVAFLQARQIARQKLPERLEIVPGFPMTPSGMVRKYRLRQMIAEKLGSEGRPVARRAEGEHQWT